MDTIQHVIKSFSCRITEKLFHSEDISQNKRKKFGDLDWDIALDNLLFLDLADEQDLLKSISLHYHSLGGKPPKYSIDTHRNSKWRITFYWENEEKTDVQLVKIENTH